MKQLDYTNLNGTIILSEEAKIGLDDESFLFGRGVFETIKILDSKPLFLDDHLTRIEKAAATIKLPPLELETLVKEINKTISANSVQSARLKIILSKTEQKLNYYIQLFELELPTQTQYEKGVKVSMVSIKKPVPIHPLSAIKSTNYLYNVLAKEEATQNNHYEGIILDDGNNICEGAYSNIFFIQDNAVHTPSTSSNILSGIIRKKVIKLLQTKQIATYVRNIHVSEIVNFNSAFLTNSIIDILPIANFDNKKFSIADLCKELNTNLYD